MGERDERVTDCEVMPSYFQVIRLNMPSWEGRADVSLFDWTWKRSTSLLHLPTWEGIEPVSMSVG